MIIATKIYRPDTVSISGWDMDETQEKLLNWWRWADNKAEIVGNSFADKLPNHRILRAGDFTVIAKKRRGHILLEAHSALRRDTRYVST